MPESSSLLNSFVVKYKTYESSIAKNPWANPNNAILSEEPWKVKWD